MVELAIFCGFLAVLLVGGAIEWVLSHFKIVNDFVDYLMDVKGMCNYED